jgi:tetratricopeptide (TPR) repeat protein
MKRPMNSQPATESSQTALQEALALYREGKHELAMKGYVAVLQQNPGNIDALYYIAVLVIQQGQIAEGLKVLQRAIDLAPPEARLHNLKGQAHLRQNERDNALKSFSRAIEIDPAFPDAYGNRATLLSEMGRPEEAIPDFDRALALRSNNGEDHCNRASAMADLGRFDEALADYSRAVALMPGRAPAYFNRADVLLRIGRPVDALRDCDQAIKLYPELAGAHCSRGLALKRLSFNSAINPLSIWRRPFGAIGPGVGARTSAPGPKHAGARTRFAIGPERPVSLDQGVGLRSVVGRLSRSRSSSAGRDYRAHSGDTLGKQ